MLYCLYFIAIQCYTDNKDIKFYGLYNKKNEKSNIRLHKCYFFYLLGRFRLRYFAVYVFNARRLTSITNPPVRIRFKTNAKTEINSTGPPIL